MGGLATRHRTRCIFAVTYPARYHETTPEALLFGEPMFGSRDPNLNLRACWDQRQMFTLRLSKSLVEGSATDNASLIVTAQTSRPFTSINDLWRRAGVKAAVLTHLAEADAFRSSLGLARRVALWVIKALRDEPLPLFAAAQVTREAEEPDVLLQPCGMAPR